MELLSAAYLKQYSERCKLKWLNASHKLRARSVFSVEDFEYYLVASSLFSSKIEGNTLDFNSYYRNRGKKNFNKKKEVEEIENLVTAYKFASENALDRDSFLTAHKLFSKTMLPAPERGRLRKHPVGVHDATTGRTVYIAVEPTYVKDETAKLFSDIAILLERKLSYKEVFYYASMIHLWTAMIHPFGDGNGRAARLLEKWFMASKLGRAAWSVNTEKYYWDNRPAYYKNIALGFNYYALYWDRCLPFLLMLPKALGESLG